MERGLIDQLKMKLMSSAGQDQDVILIVSGHPDASITCSLLVIVCLTT